MGKNNPVLWTVLVTLVDVAVTLSAYHSDLVAGILSAVAVLLALYSFREWILLPPLYRSRIDALKSLSFGGKMSLAKAATIAYEEAKGSGAIGADAAERIAKDKSENGVLDFLASYFAGLVTIYGRPGPSAGSEPIDELKGMYGEFQDGASVLLLRGYPDSRYVDLRVSSSDLRQVVASIKADLKASGDA